MKKMLNAEARRVSKKCDSDSTEHDTRPPVKIYREDGGVTWVRAKKPKRQNKTGDRLGSETSHVGISLNPAPTEEEFDAALDRAVPPHKISPFVHPGEISDLRSFVMCSQGRVSADVENELMRHIVCKMRLSISQSRKAWKISTLIRKPMDFEFRGAHSQSLGRS